MVLSDYQPLLIFIALSLGCIFGFILGGNDDLH